MLLQLCLFVVTVIELTSTQYHEVTQQENDTNGCCERTEQSCNQVQLVNSQLLATVSKLQNDVQQIMITNNQLMTAVAELKTGKQQKGSKGRQKPGVNPIFRRQIVVQEPHLSLVFTRIY